MATPSEAIAIFRNSRWLSAEDAGSHPTFSFSVLIRTTHLLFCSPWLEIHCQKELLAREFLKGRRQ